VAVDKNCSICGRAFLATTARHSSCGPECSRERNRRFVRDYRHRAKQDKLTRAAEMRGRHFVAGVRVRPACIDCAHWVPCAGADLGHACERGLMLVCNPWRHEATPLNPRRIHG
jgi:hypothetical protein